VRCFILIILIVFGSTLFLGCITKRGTKVDAPSIGREIAPSQLERQPNGTFRLKPKEIDIPLGIPYNPALNNVKVTSLAAPAKPIISHPKPAPAQSAKANETLPTAKGVGKITPFSPTVTDASNIKVNVRPITHETQTATNEQTNETTIKTEEEVKINWYELWTFYAAAVMVLVIIWLAYGAKKDVGKLNKELSSKDKKKHSPKKKK